MVEQSLRPHGARTGTQASPRVETLRLPPEAPPTNHGRTVAAWTTTFGVLIGSLVSALAVAFAVVWLFWVGLGLVLLTLVLGKVLQVVGFGQGGHRTARSSHGH